MKALSIRQPWAWLIAHGIKTVENRTWKTEFRGRFFIHASEKFDMTGKNYAEFKRELEQGAREDGIDLTLPVSPSDFEKGGIVGAVDLVDCVTECEDEYDCLWHVPGNYAFLLDNAEPLPFRPMKGKLHFFEINESHRIPEFRS